MTDSNQETKQISTIPKITVSTTSGDIDLYNTNYGSPTILVFYPADESPVCSNQLAIYNQALTVFNRYEASIYGISKDNMKSHNKFSRRLNLKFPLISDRNDENGLTELFGVKNPETNAPKRAIFVFNANNELVWSQTYPDEVNPGAEGILEALDQINEQSN